jgi:DNA repair ATPase RecN
LDKLKELRGRWEKVKAEKNRKEVERDMLKKQLGDLTALELDPEELRRLIAELEERIELGASILEQKLDEFEQHRTRNTG